MTEIEIPLGQRALAYVKKSLGEGRTLAEQLLKHLDIDAGLVCTFLPPEADIELAKIEFEWSVMPLAPRSQWVWQKKTSDGKEPVAIPVQKVDSPQINIVQEFLNASSDHIFILEDTMRQLTDPHVSRLTHPIWAYGKELHHIVFGGQAPTKDEIRRVISSSSSAWQHFIGVLTSWPNLAEFHLTRHELTLKELSNLAARAEKLLIGAYDNDGYLVWSRKKISS